MMHGSWWKESAVLSWLTSMSEYKARQSGVGRGMRSTDCCSCVNRYVKSVLLFSALAGRNPQNDLSAPLIVI